METATDSLKSWKGLTCLGATRLLERPKTVLLNSSQGKQPTGAHPWVESTLRAVNTMDPDRTTFLSSIGLNTWELVCWKAGVRRIPQIVAVPDCGDRPPEELYAELLVDFGLAPERTCAVLIPAKKGKPKSWWNARDETWISLADTAVPISIRKSGRMESLLAKRSKTTRINDEWRVPWSPSRRTKTPFEFDLGRIRSEVDPTLEHWLVHWTRAADGPWPGETRADYYRDVAGSCTEYVRSAQKTLDRIGAEKRLRPSIWRIRGRTPVVSLTALPPSQAVSLMRWRTRYARYTIEPYGIAVSRKVADAVGIRPVAYSAKTKLSSAVPTWLVQAPGVRGEWPLEMEYRHPGILDLGALPAHSWKRIDLSGFLLGNE